MSEGTSVGEDELEARRSQTLGDPWKAVGGLVFAVFVAFFGVQEVRHWLWEKAWAANGVVGEGQVLRYTTYERCSEGRGWFDSCTDYATLTVAVAEPSAPDGVVTRVISEVPVADVRWIEQGRTVEVYLDPGPSWNFVLKTDLPAVPWNAVWASLFCLVLLAVAAGEARTWSRSRRHRPSGQALPKWVRRSRPGGPTTGTPWA